MDTLSGSRRIFPLERQNVGKKVFPSKLSSFYTLPRTLHVPRERREKDLCHNREKRTIHLREEEREREREHEDTIIERDGERGGRYVSDEHELRRERR